ncbi:MAG: exopolysaccharide biosynthesis protein [Rhodobacteraceae bacterium]|jgi:hypothetical protein|nr:exopolysaccharide biosynthesis protein [Paracoccaceae bacterium]
MDATSLPASATPARAADPRLSEVFAALAAEERDRVSIRDVVEALGDRSFAPVMILLAVPNAIPFIPGSSTVLGLLLALVAVQLLAGRRRVWLPERLNRWSFDRDAFGRLVDKVTPWLVRFEKMAKPRFWPESYRLAERLAGAVAIVLSLMIMLPIPFANGVPAIAICLLALGISERDGVWLGAGLLVGAVAAGIVAGLFLAGFAAAATLW